MGNWYFSIKCLFFFPVFSLFSIVTFKNEGCSSSDNGRNGTCYTSSECQNKGGKAQGNCAAGFGVCCVFILTTTGDISENCSYIQNPSFPAVYGETTSLTYTIRKCSSGNSNSNFDRESISNFSRLWIIVFLAFLKLCTVDLLFFLESGDSKKKLGGLMYIANSKTQIGGSNPS